MGALDNRNTLLTVRRGTAFPAVDRIWFRPRAKSWLNINQKESRSWQLGWSGWNMLIWQEDVSSVDK